MKKIVSVILAVALVISMCAVMSFAAEDYVVDLSTVEFTNASGGEHAPTDIPELTRFFSITATSLPSEI